MKAAIIGCGYVGMAVARVWREKGLDVLVTTTRPERVAELSELANQVVVLKASESDRLKAALADRQVVLLSVAAGRGGDYRETYLNTAKTLASVLPETALEQLIYTSTCSVYGQHQGAWVTEMMPPVPSSENGKIIEQTEAALLAAETPQRQVCILRLGGIYGPNRTLEGIYRRVAGTTRPGKGDEGTNWVHLSDIVGAVDWAREKRLSGLYNVVQDEVPTIRSLIERVCTHYQIPEITWDESLPSPRDNIRVSNAKLKSTGYRFVHPSFEF